MLVNKVPLEAFDAALTFGQWVERQGNALPDISTLQALRDGTPERAAWEQLLAACLAVERDGQVRQLTVSDVRQMPIPMAFEATFVVLETNIDFFMQALAAIQPIQRRLMSIGTQSPSSSSQPGMIGSRSGATASPS